MRIADFEKIFIQTVSLADWFSFGGRRPLIYKIRLVIPTHQAGRLSVK